MDDIDNQLPILHFEFDLESDEAYALIKQITVSLLDNQRFFYESCILNEGKEFFDIVNQKNAKFWNNILSSIKYSYSYKIDNNEIKIYKTIGDDFKYKTFNR